MRGWLGNKLCGSLGTAKNLFEACSSLKRAVSSRSRTDTASRGSALWDLTVKGRALRGLVFIPFFQRRETRKERAPIYFPSGDRAQHGAQPDAEPRQGGRLLQEDPDVRVSGGAAARGGGGARGEKRGHRAPTFLLCRCACCSCVAWPTTTLRPPCLPSPPLPSLPQNSDLTEATLTGAWLSIAAAVVMFFLLVAVRPFLFHV